jgi:membrane protease YdiL (CAAX protease family)
MPILIIGVLWDRLGGYNLTDSFFIVDWRELGLGVIIGLLIVFFTFLSFKIFPWLKGMEDFFTDILGHLNLSSILALALLSSLAEEILFRGILLTYLGFWISSILFGVLHFPIKKILIPWTIFAHAVGFLFAWLMETYQNLAMVSLVHFTINFINLIILTNKNKEKSLI